MIDHTYDVPGNLYLRQLHNVAIAPLGVRSLLLAALLLLTPRLAHAEADGATAHEMAPTSPVVAQQMYAAATAALPAFGRSGQIFVSLGSESLFQGIWALGFEHFFGAELSPAVGYFFDDHLYVRLGADLSLDQFPKATQDAGDIRTVGMSLAPSLGYAWHVHPKVSVAPFVGVGAGRIWRSVPFSGYRSTVDVRLGAPVVFDFLEHVSFFASPTYKQLVYNRETFPESSRRASLGGRFGVEMGAIAHF